MFQKFHAIVLSSALLFACRATGQEWQPQRPHEDDAPMRRQALADQGFCDDGIDCTIDSFDNLANECVHTPDDAFCDDGNLCNGVETCDTLDGCLSGDPVDCDDGVSCTVDSCVAASGDCRHAPRDASCGDDLFCNGVETCDEIAGCQPGDDPCDGGGCLEQTRQCMDCIMDEDCDDDSECTDDFCTDGICVHEASNDVALDGGEMVLVVGFESNSVERYHHDTGNALGAFVGPFGGGLNGPEDAVYGPDGNLYVSSTGTHSVLRYHWPTGVLMDAFVKANSGGLQLPSGLLWGLDGNLYVSSLGTQNVLKYDGVTGQFLGVFVHASPECRMNDIADMVWGPDGNLYVACTGNNSVRRYHYPTGQPLGSFVSPGSGGLEFPCGLTWGPDGSLYVSSFETDSVLRYYYPTGQPLGSFVAPRDGGLDGPCGLLFNQDALYVTSFETDSVLRYHWPTGLFAGAFIRSGSGGLDGPTSILEAAPICDSKFIYRTLGKQRRVHRKRVE